MLELQKERKEDEKRKKDLEETLYDLEEDLRAVEEDGKAAQARAVELVQSSAGKFFFLSSFFILGADLSLQPSSPF